jgi:UDP-glucose 4-epimerase
MKVIVTGGVGFVGTNLIKRLLKDGNEVVSLDNYSTGKKENEQDGCKYIDVDISDSLRRHKGFGLEQYKLEKPDIIYHLGALARIQPSLKKPVKTIKNNFVSTLHILDYAREKGIPVVYAGSSTFHHGLWGSPYAWSKHSGEQLCELYTKVFGLRTSICRFYNVYGEHQLEDGAYSTVVGIFQKLYREGKPLTVTGDGEQRRDFTHINDIVEALTKMGDGLLGTESSLINGETFELGRGKNFSINELAKMFGETEVEYIPARDGEYDYTLADSSKAKKLLGWNPTLDISDYISDIIDDKS